MRIDVLIHVYNHAINSLILRAEQLDTQLSLRQIISSSADAKNKRLRIVDGLAVLEAGTALDVMRLRVFALDQVQTAAAAGRSAAHVLLTVRECSLVIQDKPREAEQSGELLPLPTV